MSGTAVDACERTIRRQLLLGELRPGQRLPPERALAEHLGVNRTTLRAALTRLSSARLLRVRQGSGYVVQDYRRVAGLELLPEIAELMKERGDGVAAMISDLLEVRRRVARMALERLVARADEGALDVRGIEAAIAGLTRVVGEDARDVDRIAEADLDVTAAILDATGSPVLGLILNPITLVVHQLEPLRRAIYRAPLGNVAAYQLVLGWLSHPSLDAVDAILEELARRDEATVRYLSE